MLKKFSTFAKKTIAATALSCIAITSVAAEDIRIGAMREGTAWYVFAATLEQMIESLGGANLEVIARGGGVANPMVVQSGRAEIALANVASAIWAAEGADVYQGKKAPDIRALVGGLNSVYVGAIARQDFLKERGTSDLKEILTSGDPVRILMKPVGSSAVPVAHMVLESLGTSAAQIKKNGGDIIQVGAGQIADQMRNGNADIYFDTILKGHPTITEVSLTVDVAFLDLPKETQDFIVKHGLSAGEFGPWFSGQDSPTIGANIGTVLIGHASLSDETAYMITKTLIENADLLKEAHGAWKRFDPTKAWLPENTGIPLHPGAERYYREAGLM
ncbi:TAXI family TRAP transporter solute-binding subunit [Cohaesibacter celericrescens]|uniref:TRAP transporter substrate-binding protein n=1 Tax=Cohaesibacter celericrescens TaxID=2067669 RepID=A0A2N5XQ26_9HYPH|nr:TAXI family TRAP transporter solute-binding subunit [Cohaesibacter celericrescens]PLW76530.1 TRAP transporter substrate-binding protein [Cohaesibacter celericrescens]